MARRTLNRPLAHLTDAQLDAHLANLDSWLEFQIVDLEDALDERESRGRGAYVLSPTAEDYLAHNPRFQGAAA